MQRLSSTMVETTRMRRSSATQSCARTKPSVPPSRAGSDSAHRPAASAAPGASAGAGADAALLPAALAAVCRLQSEGVWSVRAASSRPWALPYAHSPGARARRRGSAAAATAAAAATCGGARSRLVDLAVVPAVLRGLDDAKHARARAAASTRRMRSWRCRGSGSGTGAGAGNSARRGGVGGGGGGGDPEARCCGCCHQGGVMGAMAVVEQRGKAHSEQRKASARGTKAAGAGAGAAAHRPIRDLMRSWP